MAEFVTASWSRRRVRRRARRVTAPDGTGGGADHRRSGRPTGQGGRQTARPLPAKAGLAAGVPVEEVRCRTASASSSSRPRGVGRRQPADRRDDVRTRRRRIEIPPTAAGLLPSAARASAQPVCFPGLGGRWRSSASRPSDRYAAGHSDIVFAKESLERADLHRRGLAVRARAGPRSPRSTPGWHTPSPRSRPTRRRWRARDTDPCSAARRSGARDGSTRPRRAADSPFRETNRLALAPYPADPA
jgi:hypothetical protein